MLNFKQNNVLFNDSKETGQSTISSDSKGKKTRNKHIISNNLFVSHFNTGCIPRSADGIHNRSKPSDMRAVKELDVTLSNIFVVYIIFLNIFI
jgi:hypothetical protein